MRPALEPSSPPRIKIGAAGGSCTRTICLEGRNAVCYITTAAMGPARRLALRSRTYRVRVLLLNDAGDLGPGVGLAPTSSVYETDASLAALTRQKWRPRRDSHPVRAGLQPAASTTLASRSHSARSLNETEERKSGKIMILPPMILPKNCSRNSAQPARILADSDANGVAGGSRTHTISLTTRNAAGYTTATSGAAPGVAAGTPVYRTGPGACARQNRCSRRDSHSGLDLRGVG